MFEQLIALTYGNAVIQTSCTPKKRNPSIIGEVTEVRIEVYDEERDEILKKIKTWR